MLSGNTGARLRLGSGLAVVGLCVADAIKSPLSQYGGYKRQN